MNSDARFLIARRRATGKRLPPLPGKPPLVQRMPRLATLLVLLLMVFGPVGVMFANPLAMRVRHGRSHPDAGPLLENVVYCRVGGVDLKMDVYKAKPSFANPRPVLMYVHGGGWIDGDKTWVDRILSSGELALHGYTVVSVNYRLSPLYRWPAQLEDIKCAVRSLRANAATYGIDPHRIGVWGESAGGHLVSMLGLTDPRDGFEGSGGYADQSSRVQAVVDMFGPTDFSAFDPNSPQGLLMSLLALGKAATPAVMRSVSPVTYASPDDPPFLILHGLKDTLVPFSQSQALYDRLQAAGTPSTLTLVKNGEHVFAPKGGPISPTMPQLKAMILAFFDRYLDPSR